MTHILTDPRFRIAWRSLLTDATGRGAWLAYDPADVVADLNNRYSGVMVHWVERR